MVINKSNDILSNFMNAEEIISKIKSWHARSNKEEDIFIKFMCEYLCLVAFLTNMYPEIYSDGNRINKFLANLKDQQENNQISKKESQIADKFLNYLDKTVITDHISYLKIYPLKYNNRGRLIELRIVDLNDYYHMIKFLQYVRNNLFHEIKLPEDDRDKHIIKIGYDIITPFIKSLIEYYRIND